MAVKTKAQIHAEIATLFADNNTNAITEADLRQVCDDIVDSYYDAPYKNYVVNLTQTGTSAPIVSTEFSNTLGETPVWSRTSAGIYKMTVVSPLFDENNIHSSFIVSIGTMTVPALVLFGATGIEGYIYFSRESDTVLRLTSVNNLLAATELNTLLGTNPISLPEIRVYA